VAQLPQCVTSKGRFGEKWGVAGFPLIAESADSWQRVLVGAARVNPDDVQLRHRILTMCARAPTRHGLALHDTI